MIRSNPFVIVSSKLKSHKDTGDPLMARTSVSDNLIVTGTLVQIKILKINGITILLLILFRNFFEKDISNDDIVIIMK